MKTNKRCEVTQCDEIMAEVCFLAREYGMGDPKKMTEGARKLRNFVRRRMKKIIKEFGPEFAKGALVKAHRGERNRQTNKT